MSDNLDEVAYGQREPAEKPPPWHTSVQEKAPRYRRALAYALAAVGGALALMMLLSGVLPPAGPAQATRPVWSGRLADVTGDDVLYRLEVTQAALKREVAVLSKLMSEEGVPLPEDAEVTLVLATLNARQDRLDGLVSQLQAGFHSLQRVAESFRLELSAQSQRLSQMNRMLDARPVGEGN